jgi:hypothetical protein
MEKEDIAEMLKDQVLKIENIKKDNDPNQQILTVHVSVDVFLKMAYLFIGINGK